MKRSEVNTYIREAMDFMAKHHFYLPEWAYWTPADWATKGAECKEIVENGLGWDITDFGWNDFRNTGLTLVTLRNGDPSGKGKVYCEKIMYVRENQMTPEHFHWIKTEDIINRGGGILCMKLYKSTEEETLGTEDIVVKIDGIERRVKAGEKISLRPGQSICYTPYLYHRFWAEEGDCIVGEVSSVNDDKTDNRFLEPKGRFSTIEEDAPIEHYLCNEYPAL